MLNPTSLFQSLWKDDIACIGVDGGPGTDQQPGVKAAANQLEILLDYVLFESSQNVGHLLDDRYTDLLSPEETELKELLLKLRAARAEIRSLPAWDQVAELLARLGDATSMAGYS